MNLKLLALQLKADYPIFREPVLESHPQLAATMVIFFLKNGKDCVLLLRRAAGLSNHAGEISFPGGIYEEKDGDLLTTAIRETQEEVGLQIEERSVIARLPTVKTLTEFVISPFVTILETLPALKINAGEVEEVLEVSLVSLLATQQRDIGYSPSMEMYEYCHGSNRIWGATARILHRIAAIC